MLAAAALTALALAPVPVTSAGHTGEESVLRARCDRPAGVCRGTLELRGRRRNLIGRTGFAIPARAVRRVRIDVRGKLSGPTGARIVVWMRGYRPRVIRRVLAPWVRCDTGATRLLTPTTRVFLMERVGYFACHRGGEPLRLHEHADLPTQTAYRFVVAGDVLAFVSFFGWKGSYENVHVVNLRTRSGVHRVTDVGPAWQCDASEYGCSTGPVTALAVDGDGVTAWIVRSAEREHEVRATRPGGEHAVLDSGPGIDPGTVSVSGGRVSWTNAGQPRSGAPR